MIKGELQTGLAVAQITIDFLQAPTRVHALASLVNDRTGQSIAWTEGEGGTWSKETLQCVRALQLAMEEDLAKRVFSTVAVSGKEPDKPKGLGEHLGEGSVRSI